ncbi:MAG: S49 family peptidase [Candidatus Binataceae bacterium]|nr:S49 family peptidase [Candidatus Binataceae bacterium]
MKSLARGVFGVLAVALALFASPVIAQVAKPDIIEVVDLSGEIGEGTAAQIKEQVERIRANPSAKGVLFILNTPGGGVSASATIQGELSKLKVPVVAYCETICASGGVYSLTAKSVKFVAVREDTIGGSVGVIMHMTRYNRLLDWAKVDAETFKSGLLKDSGNPTRDMSAADREYLQGIVDELAVRFYHLVAAARPKINAEQWKQIKTARIFIGPRIVAAGLADAVMTREEALAKAKELSGSKLAFTREELKKMSHAADDSMGVKAPLDGAGDSFLRDVHFLTETMREVKQGGAVSFEYKLPYTF